MYPTTPASVSEDLYTDASNGTKQANHAIHYDIMTHEYIAT